MRDFLIRIIAVVLLATTGCVDGVQGSGAAMRPTAIIGAALVDPESDNPPEIVTLVMKGNRILQLGAKVQVPPGATRIDGRGKWLTPGLWDMHAHLAAPGPIGSAPERYLGHGILGIRDMGGDPTALFALRQEIAEGRRRGPFLYMAGPTLNGESFASWHQAVPEVETARVAVRDLRSRGVDFIKVHRAMTRNGFQATMAAAREQGLTVAGHVPLHLGFVDAARSGMVSVEHVQTLLENEISAGSPPARSADEAMTRLEGIRGDAIFASLALNRTYFCPTLVGYEISWEGDSPARRAAKQELFSRMAPLVRRAADAGVPTLAGTDVLSRHGDMLLVELERLVTAGLTARKALAAATSVPRRLVGRGPGVISIGSEASFLLLDANPLEDIRNLRRLSLIVLRGEPIGPAQLSHWRNLTD